MIHSHEIPSLPSVVKAETSELQSTQNGSGQWLGAWVTTRDFVTGFVKSMSPRYVPEHLRKSGESVELKPALTFGYQDVIPKLELTARLVAAKVPSTPLIKQVTTELFSLYSLCSMFYADDASKPNSCQASVVADARRADGQDFAAPAANAASKTFARPHSCGQSARRPADPGDHTDIGKDGAIPAGDNEPGPGIQTVYGDPLNNRGCRPDHPLGTDELIDELIDEPKGDNAAGQHPQPVAGDPRLLTVNSQPSSVTDEETDENQKPSAQKDSKKFAIPRSRSQLARACGAVGLFAGMVGGAGAAPTAGRESIDIGNVEDLNKIGRHPDYPLNATYELSADIDANQLTQSIGNNNQPFTGEIKGQDHKISHLNRCLVKHQSSGSRISSIRFTDSQITSLTPAGVVACHSDGEVSNIRAENTFITTLGYRAPAGIVAGNFTGRLANMTLVNCGVQTTGDYSPAGGLGGNITVGTIYNITVVNCRLITSGFGSGAGIVSGADLWKKNDNVTTDYAFIVNCNIQTTGAMGYAGILAAWIAETKNTVAANTIVKVTGSSLSMGLIAGHYQKAINATLINNTLLSSNTETAPSDWPIEPGKDTSGKQHHLNIKMENCGFNGIKFRNIPIPEQERSTLCANADLSVLTPDCYPISKYDDFAPRITRDEGICVTLPQTTVSDRESKPVINISNAEDMNKIGHEPGHPLDAAYVLTADIDAKQLNQSIGNETHPFTGDLNGHDHKISNLNLRNCLIYRQDSGSRISNIHFINADITSEKMTGLVTCYAEGEVSNIRAENIFLSASGSPSRMGIVSSVASGAVNNITALNCTFVAHGKSSAGVVGATVSGTATNTEAINCSFNLKSAESTAAVVGGEVFGTVFHTKAENCSFNLKGSMSRAAVGGVKVGGTVIHTSAENCRFKVDAGPNEPGYSNFVEGGYAIGAQKLDGTLIDTKARNCTFKLNSRWGSIGIGSGYAMGTTEQTMALDCTIESTGIGNHIGIGSGHANGNVRKTTAVNCRIEASGHTSTIGIGAAEFWGTKVSHTTAVNCTIKALEDKAQLAIGVATAKAVGIIDHTTAVNCKIEASADDLSAGFAAGYSDGGIVKRTIVVNSSIKFLDQRPKNFTQPWSSSTALTVGSINFRGLKIEDTTLMNSSIEVPKARRFCEKYSEHLNDKTCTYMVADIFSTGLLYGSAGSTNIKVTGTRASGCRINGKVKNEGTIPADELSNLCIKADLRVVTASCHSRSSESIGSLYANNSLSTIEQCPAIGGSQVTNTPFESHGQATTTGTTVGFSQEVPGNIQIATPSQTVPVASPPPLPPTTQQVIPVGTPLTPPGLTTVATTSGVTSAATVIPTVLTIGGIVVGSVVIGYTTYQWYQAYREGLTGMEVALKPVTRIRDLLGFGPKVPIQANREGSQQPLCTPITDDMAEDIC